MFEVKSGIPAPKDNLGRKSSYPFAVMKVEQYFDAPRDMGKAANGADRRRASVAGAAYAWAKLNNPEAKFTTRTIDENTVRCWRVK